jgi:hypothetical protein
MVGNREIKKAIKKNPRPNNPSEIKTNTGGGRTELI